jgi:hypothetical protein
VDGSKLACEGGAVGIVSGGDTREVGGVLLKRLLAVEGKVGKRFAGVDRRAPHSALSPERSSTSLRPTACAKQTGTGIAHAIAL